MLYHVTGFFNILYQLPLLAAKMAVGLLRFVYKFEHLLTSIYNVGLENGIYERSFAARFYKHRVKRTFIELMDRVLFGVDGLVTPVHGLP